MERSLAGTKHQAEGAASRGMGDRMRTIRIWQVGDTHLSVERPFFQGNWDAFAALVAAERPDLVVHSGDLALDAAERPGDLDAGQAAMRALASDWLVIPGNHDVGDNQAPGHAPKRPVSAPLLATWRARFGACRWHRDIGAWRIIGLNAQLLADAPPAPLAAEAEAQWEFLARSLDTERPVLLFMHKPLFVTVPGAQAEPTLRYVPPAAAARLLALIGTTTVRIVASGHVHQHRQRSHAGIAFVWAPATAFTVPDRLQAPVGSKDLGFVAFDLHEDGSFHVSVVVPDSFVANDITDFPAAYPKPAAVAANAG